MFNHQSFLIKYDIETGTAKTVSLSGQFSQALAQDIIVIRFWLVAIDRRRNVNQPAGSVFTQPKFIAGIGNCLAFHLGLEKFFDSSSLSALMFSA